MNKSKARFAFNLLVLGLSAFFWLYACSGAPRATSPADQDTPELENTDTNSESDRPAESEQDGVENAEGEQAAESEQEHDLSSDGDTTDTAENREVERETETEQEALSCEPNPCTTPPAAGCSTNYQQILGHANPGACILENGIPSCSYAEETRSCSLPVYCWAVDGLADCVVRDANLGFEIPWQTGQMPQGFGRYAENEASLSVARSTIAHSGAGAALLSMPTQAAQVFEQVFPLEAKANTYYCGQVFARRADENSNLESFYSLRLKLVTGQGNPLVSSKNAKLLLTNTYTAFGSVLLKSALPTVRGIALEMMAVHQAGGSNELLTDDWSIFEWTDKLLGFEDAFSGGQMPKGFEAATAAFGASRDTVQTHTGSGALRLSWSSPEDQRIRSFCAYPISQGQTLSFRFWAKDSSAGGGLYGRLRPEIHFYATDYTEINASEAASGTASTNDLNWREYAFSRIAPTAGTAFAHIALRMEDEAAGSVFSATVYVDDISVEIQ